MRRAWAVPWKLRVNKESLKPGRIVCGAIFPEPVRRREHRCDGVSARKLAPQRGVALSSAFRPAARTPATGPDLLKGTDMRYQADITAGSLKVPESRVIADLLLRGVDGAGWRTAIFDE